MILRRLAIFVALFGFTSAAYAKTSSVSRLPKCAFPENHIPSGASVFSSTRAGARSEYGEFVFGTFGLVYTRPNLVRETYLFEVLRGGSFVLLAVHVDFSEVLPSNWNIDTQPIEITIANSRLPSNIDAANLGLVFSQKSASLRSIATRVVASGPTEINVGDAEVPLGSPPIRGYRHALLDYETVNRDSRATTARWTAAAVDEERGLCAGGGFEINFR